MSKSNFSRIKKFWMVYNVTRKSPPTVQHEDPWDADREAQRLAQKRQGEIFVILEAVARVQTEAYTPPKPVLAVKVKAIR